MAVNGEVKILPMMYLALSYDHRMIDGKASVTLVKTGSSNLADTMITEGINAGDIVVTGPYRVLERLKEGDAIREETAKDALEREGDTKVGVSVG